MQLLPPRYRTKRKCGNNGLSCSPQSLTLHILNNFVNIIKKQTKTEGPQSPEPTCNKHHTDDTLMNVLRSHKYDTTCKVCSVMFSSYNKATAREAAWKPRNCLSSFSHQCFQVTQQEKSTEAKTHDQKPKVLTPGQGNK